MESTLVPKANQEQIEKLKYLFEFKHTVPKVVGRKKIRFRVDNAYRTVGQVLADRGWSQVDGESEIWDFFWCDLARLGFVLEKRLQGSQMVPHFRNHYELSRKNHLARNMGRYKKTLLREGKVEEALFCDYIPLTFELPAEFLRLEEYCRTNPGKTYIVKPAIGCKGKGIFLFKKIKELKKIWKGREWFRTALVEVVNKRGKVFRLQEKLPEIWVVQVYIDNPYLISGRKFDIRFYVLVISYLPLTVWVARDGFARVCGAPYDLNNLKDTLCHLTNTSLQLARGNINKGYKWPLRQVREYLVAQHGVRAFDDLLQKIANLIITSLKSVQKVIMHSKHCFEMYGYDVLLSEQLEPWLLEVNASPSLEATDEEDFKLKYNLLTDMFNILDMENNHTGAEIRIGGFDLLWDDGPIHMPPPSPDECGPIIKNPMLNIHLGSYNNRNESLTMLQEWKKFMTEDLGDKGKPPQVNNTANTVNSTAIPLSNTP